MTTQAAPAADADAPDTRLRITEIFVSLQGESTRVGLPTVFVRLTGCPLRCTYCDTAYAFQGGQSMALSAIVDAVASYRVHHVCVTGGEPLAQRACLPLLTALCDQGYSVSLETSGALDAAPVDPRVSLILDIKTPASGESERTVWSNFEALRPHDEVKFVLCDRADYEWAVTILRGRQLHERCTVLFSHSHEQLPGAVLADWIVADRLPVRFQTQLHKQLWGSLPGR